MARNDIRLFGFHKVLVSYQYIEVRGIPRKDQGTPRNVLLIFAQKPQAKRRSLAERRGRLEYLKGKTPNQGTPRPPPGTLSRTR